MTGVHGIIRAIAAKDFKAPSELLQNCHNQIVVWKSAD
jgi:hypothetical protein